MVKWEGDGEQTMLARKDRAPEYKTKSQDKAYLVPLFILKRLEKQGVKLAEHSDDLNQDQIDTLLLELIALSHQYLLTPGESSIAQETKRVKFLKDLKGKKSVDAILDEFEKIEREFLEKRARAEARKKSDEPLSESVKSSEGETPIETYRSLLREQIIDILRHPAVHEAYKDHVKTQSDAGKTHEKTLRKIERAEQLGHDARQELRTLRGEQALSREQTPKGVKRKKTFGIASEVAHRLRDVMVAAEQKVNDLTTGLSDEGRGMLMARRMLRRKEELETRGFVLSPSREQLVDEINELISQGYRVFLAGPTGTGKTSLGVFAMSEITEGQYEIFSWSGESSARDLFGSPKITTTEQGLETTMSTGPYTRAITGKTRGIIHEEMTSGSTSVQLSAKALWNARAGESIHLPGFNGYEFTKEELAEIATGNLQGKRHAQREEMDPAIAREFKALDVQFMPSDETFEYLLLPHLIDRAAFFPVRREDIEMIDKLCKAAELSQLAYLERIPADIKANPIYSLISPSGADIRLTKVFLDTGTTESLIAGWHTSGKPLQEYVRDQLYRFIYKNPHFTELEQERTNIINIFRAYGFDLRKGNNFFAPSSEVKKLTQPYVLPSEMGFLLPKPALSNADEFGVGDTDDKNDDKHTAGAWKEFDWLGTPFRYQEKSYEDPQNPGTLLYPGDVFMRRPDGTPSVTYIGIGENGEPLLLPADAIEEPKKIGITIKEKLQKAEDVYDLIVDSLNETLVKVPGLKQIVDPSINWVNKRIDLPKLASALHENVPPQYRLEFFQKLFADFPNSEELVAYIQEIYERKEPYIKSPSSANERQRILDDAIDSVASFINGWNAIAPEMDNFVPLPVTANITDRVLTSNDATLIYEPAALLYRQSKDVSLDVIGDKAYNLLMDLMIDRTANLPATKGAQMDVETYANAIIGKQQLENMYGQSIFLLYQEFFSLTRVCGVSYLGVYRGLVGGNSDIINVFYVPPVAQTNQ